MKKLIIALLATSALATPAFAATNTATMELLAHVTSSCQMVLGNAGTAEFNVIGGKINSIDNDVIFKNSLNVKCTAGTPYQITMTSRNAGRNPNYNYALMNEALANPAQSPIPYVVTQQGYYNNTTAIQGWADSGAVAGSTNLTSFFGGPSNTWSGLQPGSIIVSDSGWDDGVALTANTTDGYGGLNGYISFPFEVSPVAPSSGQDSNLSQTSLQAGTYSDTLIFNQVF